MFHPEDLRVLVAALTRHGNSSKRAEFASIRITSGDKYGMHLASASSKKQRRANAIEADYVTALCCFTANPTLCKPLPALAVRRACKTSRQR
jgi:hypothetical protein